MPAPVTRQQAQTLAGMLPGLFVERQERDRRQCTEEGPPWVTEEGFVMEERRSGADRRTPEPD